MLISSKLWASGHLTQPNPFNYLCLEDFEMYDENSEDIQLSEEGQVRIIVLYDSNINMPYLIFHFVWVQILDLHITWWTLNAN